MRKLIETTEDIKTGVLALCEICPRLTYAFEISGMPPLRRRDDGFAQLLSAIVSQQVSTAAASAIWERVHTAGFVTPDAVLAADDEQLRAVGLSRPKVRYARALAEADLDFVAMRTQPDEEVIADLVAVAGIGRWTAEIYAMFSLGRPDVFAPGDLALQEAVRDLYGLDERPTERALRERAADWSPYRAVAARLLWAYYGAIKDREGIR